MLAASASDPDTHMAVAVCRNKLFNASSPEEDPILPSANALRGALSAAIKRRRRFALTAARASVKIRILFE